MGLIYIIEFENGKVYIGQTIFTREYRLKQHEKASRSDSQLAVHRAMRKHTYVCKTLVEVENEKLNELEIHYINEYGSKGPKGYNMTLGGESTVGYEFTEEAKERISASVTAHYENHPESIVHLSQKAKERFEDPEERRHLSEMATKRFEDPEERKRLSEMQIKRFEDPAERQKSSENMVRFYEEHPEARVNLSEKAHAQWSEQARLEQSVRKKEQYQADPTLRTRKKEFYENNPEKLAELSRKRVELMSTPEMKQKIREASKKREREKFTRPTFCAYKYKECEGEEGCKRIVTVHCPVCGNLCGHCDSSIHIGKATRIHERYQIEPKELIGEWDYIPDCVEELVSKGLFPEGTNKISAVLNGKRNHTHGIYFRYKD